MTDKGDSTNGAAERDPVVPPDGLSSGAAQVSMLQIRGVLDAAEQAGVAAQRLLDSVAFDPSRLDAQDAWATVEELDRLIEAAIHTSNDPAFGLHWGETTSGIRLGVLAPLVASSKTLRDAYAAMVRYQHIISEFDEVEALATEQGLRLRCAGPATSELAARARKELAVVGFTRMLRHFCGRDGMPSSVAFDYPPPPYHAEYTRIFEGRARFRQDWCGVDVPAALLDVPQPGWSVELHRVMEEHAEAALASLEGSLSIRARVLRALRHAFPRWLEMNEVARELDVSERTLRRHLSRDGVTFAELLAEVQCEIATRLLRDPSRTIQQVAYEMGFSTPSAFHRAFKRWTGQSPSEVRPSSRRPPA